MKILLLGEYSNVHWTLAQGLRTLGHQVTVISDGDGWKNYKRDIDLRRRSLRPLDTIGYIAHIMRLLPRMRGYDIVQIINPVFFNLRAGKMMPFYRYLRRHNTRLVMGAFGMDHYWVKTCIDCTTFRYSDFNIGSHLRTDEPCNRQFVTDWLHGEKSQLNIDIANDCDAIVAGLYEYYRCYHPEFSDKTVFIPFPIKMPDSSDNMSEQQSHNPDHGNAMPHPATTKVSFFIGIQRGRSEYKGTDIMLRALRRIEANYPDRCELRIAESVPFDTYQQMIQSADVLIDQLYSYTPAMNALLAMSKGMVAVTGGEPENYEILGETHLRPIVNVQPDEDDCYRSFEQLVLHPELLPRLKAESVEYVRRHHEYTKVALQYQKLYQRLLNSPTPSATD